MAENRTGEVELVKLGDGGRVLRLIDAASGLTLERRLDPERPVYRQRQELGEILQAAVARAQLMPA